AVNAAAAEMIGASAKSSGSAADGRSSSLNINLTMSASGWRSPLGPTRYGPSRCCISAATFRSTYTMMAAEFSSITKTNSVRTIWAMNRGVMLNRSSVRADRMPRAPVGRQRAAALADMRLVLVPEMLDRRQHRGDGGIAECAERFAGNVSRDAQQQIEI